MPRRIDPRFGTDDMVMLSKDECCSPEQFDRVLDHLSGEFDRPSAAAALAALADQDLRWKRQSLSDVSQSQCNEQIRQIAIALEALDKQPPDKQHKATARVQAMIKGLSGEAFLALCATPPLCLRDDGDPWCLESLSANLVAVSKAAKTAVRAVPGQKPAISLAITVGHLLDIYEAATGLKATHTPYAGIKYDGEPHSKAGLFARAFFHTIDAQVRPGQVSTALAREIKARGNRTIL